MTIPNLCNPDGSCSHTCDQGQCLSSVNASRRALWLRPLHTKDGGHRVSGDDSLRLHSRPLPPDPAPQEDHGIYFWLAIVFAAFVTAYFQPFNF